MVTTSGGKKGATSGDIKTWDGSNMDQFIGILLGCAMICINMKCFLHQQFYYKQINILLVERWKKIKVANLKHLAEEKG